MLVTCEELKVGEVHRGGNIPRMTGWYGAQKLALNINLKRTALTCVKFIIIFIQ
jgi:hypothetical protein